MMSHSSSSSYPYLILDPRCLARMEEDRAKLPFVLYNLLRLFFLLFPVLSDAHMLLSSLIFFFSVYYFVSLGSEKKERDGYSVVSYSSVIQGVASFSSSLIFRHSHVHDSTQVDFVIVCVDEQSMTVGLGRLCRMSHVARLDRRRTLERQRKRYESCKSRKRMPIDTASFQRPSLYLSLYFCCWPCSSTFLDRSVPFCSRVPDK